jgi:hypothetical protein
MTIDLEKLLQMELGYPGISFGYHAWALGAYLESLEHIVGLAQEQYQVRGEKDLEKRRDEFEPEELVQRLDEVKEAAHEHIPRYARLSALIPIWGLFESSVEDITAYVAKRAGVKLKLNEIRAENFLVKVQKYYAGVLEIPLPWSKQDNDEAATLYEIRNAIAHRNGQFRDAPPEKRRKIEALVARTAGVVMHRNQLVVQAEYLEHAAELVFRMIGDLNQVIIDRNYGRPSQMTNPGKEKSATAAPSGNVGAR